MRKGLTKITSAIAGLIALVGINVGTVQASTPHVPNDKTPLVLEHGSVFHSLDAAHAPQTELSEHYSHSSHASHSSHESHYSHYSSR